MRFEPAIVARAEKFFAELPQPTSQVIGDRQAFPRLPRARSGTTVFSSTLRRKLLLSESGMTTSVFNRIDNPIGPAFVTWTEERYVIDRRRMNFDEWNQNPTVIEARVGGAPKGPKPPWVIEDNEG